MRNKRSVGIPLSMQVFDISVCHTLLTRLEGICVPRVLMTPRSNTCELSTTLAPPSDRDL